MIIPVVAILCVLLLMIAECARATIYQNTVEDYKKSVKVLNLKDSISILQRTVKDYDASYFCDIDQSKIALDTTSSVSSLMASIREQIEQAKPVPAFSSLLDFLPRPHKARAVSVDMKKATDQITELVVADARSTYCMDLSSALLDINFIQSLKKPEGVSALLPGQVEDYQVKTSNVVELLLNMKFPSNLEQEHIKLIEAIKQIEIDLRGNDNNYKQFSRTIETDVANIDLVLAEIKIKSLDLQLIPEQLDIAVSILE